MVNLFVLMSLEDWNPAYLEFVKKEEKLSR